MELERPDLIPITLEDQAGICPAESEAVRKNVIDLSITRSVRHVIKIAIGIGKFVVDRWRKLLLLNRLY